MSINHWGKVYGSLVFSPKWAGLSLEARGLWISAFALCLSIDSKGVLPKYFVGNPLLFGNPKKPKETQETQDNPNAIIEELVFSGLWEETETAYVFHDWEDYQASQKRAEAARLNGLKGGRPRKNPVDGGNIIPGQGIEKPKKTEENPGKPKITQDNPTGNQTKPNETQEKLDKDKDIYINPPLIPPLGEKPKTKRATQIPEDWTPNQHHKELAQARGVDVWDEAEKMRDWARAEGKTGKDWDARFRNWLKNAKPQANHLLDRQAQILQAERQRTWNLYSNHQMIEQ